MNTHWLSLEPDFDEHIIYKLIGNSCRWDLCTTCITFQEVEITIIASIIRYLKIWIFIVVRYVKHWLNIFGPNIIIYRLLEALIPYIWYIRLYFQPINWNKKVLMRRDVSCDILVRLCSGFVSHIWYAHCIYIYSDGYIKNRKQVAFLMPNQ